MYIDIAIFNTSTFILDNMTRYKQYLDLFPRFIQKIYKSYQNKKKKSRWIKQGQPLPIPHILKQETINEYQIKHKATILVESGTYLGDMVWAQQDNFDKIYTIELSKSLHQQAQKRFRKKEHIYTLQGDSGTVMATIVKELTDKTLFWLDGHYSGGITARGDKDCPIWDELKAILSTDTEHVILIDDARLFIGERDYPSLEGVKIFILEQYPHSKIDVKNDIIIVELEK